MIWNEAEQVGVIEISTGMSMGRGKESDAREYWRTTTMGVASVGVRGAKATVDRV